MSAHDDVVTAARALRDQGHPAFTVAELISTARRYGSTHPEAVLRKTVMGMMDDPENPTQARDLLVEVRRGYFRLRS
jgi:hypothetical protein